MKSFTKKTTKINFKKVAKIYIIFLLVAAVGSAVLLGLTFWDKISVWSSWERIEEKAKRGDISALHSNLQKLAGRSDDVVDVIVLDKDNTIVFSATDSAFGQDSTLNLLPVSDYKNGHRYFYDEDYPDALFKLQKEEEFFFPNRSVRYIEEFFKDFDDDYFFRDDFSDKELYGLSYIINKNTGEKVYLITDVQPVANGLMLVTIVAALGVLFLMAYWVLIALWVYADAAKTGQNPAIWGLAALLTNLAGLIVYLLYKNSHQVCHHCGVLLKRFSRYCTSCGTAVGQSCEKCGQPISKKDRYCSGCGQEVCASASEKKAQE